MPSLYLLLILSFLFVLLIGVALWWAIFSGQFDDVRKFGESILQDDDTAHAPPAAVRPRKKILFQGKKHHAS